MRRMRLSVERACCWQAVWILRYAGRNIHHERIAAGITNFSAEVGPIHESYAYTKGRPQPICTEALELLAWASR